jgi:hypothetical protein
MVPLMSESLDRQLSIRERLRLRLHLLVCVWCVRYLQQIKLLRRLSRDRPLATGELSASLTVETQERIAKSLQNREL